MLAPPVGSSGPGRPRTKTLRCPSGLYFGVSPCRGRDMVVRWLRQASAPESQHHHGFLLRLSTCPLASIRLRYVRRGCMKTRTSTLTVAPGRGTAGDFFAKIKNSCQKSLYSSKFTAMHPPQLTRASPLRRPGACGVPVQCILTLC